jgi:hypothetical protein
MPWKITLRVKDNRNNTVKASESIGMLRPTISDLMNEASVTLDRIGAVEPLREGVTVSIIATYQRKQAR